MKARRKLGWRLEYPAIIDAPLISERVTAGMQAAKVRGKHLGRPPTPAYLVTRIEALAQTTDLSVRQIHRKIDQRAGRGVVGDIVKRVRNNRATS